MLQEALGEAHGKREKQQREKEIRATTLRQSKEEFKKDAQQ